MDSLYIATRGPLVKIGIAGEPARRVRRQKAVMLWCSGPHEGAAWVEYAACRAMKRRVVPGKREWFTVRPEVALRVVLRAFRRSRAYPHVAEAIGVSKSLIYQRARDEWAPRIAEGGGK
jgi:hypothetical protein